MWKLLRRRQAIEQSSLQTLLQRAIDYTQRIEELLQGDSSEHQQRLLAQIYTWRQTIEMMVRALADLDRNGHLVQGDLGHLPNVIADLERQLAGETNALLRSDLEQMLRQRENQQPPSGKEIADQHGRHEYHGETGHDQQHEQDRNATGRRLTRPREMPPQDGPGRIGGQDDRCHKRSVSHCEPPL